MLFRSVLMDERDRAVFALDGRWANRIRRFAQRNAPPDPTQWEDRCDLYIVKGHLSLTERFPQILHKGREQAGI